MKLHSQNFDELLGGHVSFSALRKVMMPNKPEGKTATKAALGLGSSYITVIYYSISEVYYIAKNYIEILKKSNSERYLNPWIRLKEEAEKLMRAEEERIKA